MSVTRNPCSLERLCPPRNKNWKATVQRAEFVFILSDCTEIAYDHRTLAQYLARLEKDMEERDILIIFQQMLSALKYIHVNNILHRWVLV